MIFMLSINQLKDNFIKYFDGYYAAHQVIMIDLTTLIVLFFKISSHLTSPFK